METGEALARMYQLGLGIMNGGAGFFHDPSPDQKAVIAFCEALDQFSVGDGDSRLFRVDPSDERDGGPCPAMLQWLPESPLSTCPRCDVAWGVADGMLYMADSFDGRFIIPLDL